MSSIRSILDSTRLLILLTVMSVAISFALGIAFDMTIAELIQVPEFVNILPQWDSSDDVRFYTNLFYLILRIPAILAIMIVILASVRETDVGIEQGQQEFQQQVGFDNSQEFEF